MLSPFTVYRNTTAFMDTLNFNDENNAMHLARTFSLFSSKEHVEKNVLTLNKMLTLGHIVPVARVDCKKEALIYLTTHIEGSWLDNDEVTLTSTHEDGFMCSSSIGDIFVDSDGVALMVSIEGFVLLKGSIHNASLTVSEFS